MSKRKHATSCVEEKSEDTQSVWGFLSWLLSEYTESRIVRRDGRYVVFLTPGGHIFSTTTDYGTKED